VSADRPSFAFGPFRLDGITERLERGQEEIELPPRPLALLRYFLERPGRLVLKEELLEALWPGTYVTEGVLKTHVNEVRRALGDDAREPRFLATVHRRGYRFVCDVAVDTEAQRPGTPFQASAAPAAPRETAEPTADARAFVGRTAEVARLATALDAALAGRRGFVFVAGEAGIGKTTLVDFFLTSRASDVEIAVGRGQCLEGAGPGEPYGPVLEALGGLARGSHAAQIVPLLRRYAPSWVAQLPWLVAEAERSALAHELLGVTRERMLREIAEALEAIAALVPVLVVLEDLQWSDPATLDLCATLARRREPSRLLVLATYRPADAILAGGALRRLRGELVTRGHASEVLLELLTRDAVAAYLEARLAPVHPAPSLAKSLYEQTDGNALFLRTVVDDLIARGALAPGDDGVSLGDDAELAVPESVREMIEGQIERLPAEVQRWLEAGSLVGPTFEAMAAAHATDSAPDEVEDRLAELAARGEMIREVDTAELSDGEITARFSFVHSLHQQVLAERPSPVQAARWHLRLGTWLEESWGDRARDHAARLALHYERGRAPLRAVRWLRESARLGAHRRAYPEARDALARALDLAATLARTDRLEAERETFELRGLVHRSSGDFGAATEDFATAAARAAEASEHAARSRALLLESSAAFVFDPPRADLAFRTARDLAWEVGDPLLSVRVRALAGFGRLRLRGYRKDDDEASVRAVKAVRQAGDRALVGEQLGRRAFFDVVTGRYREAEAAAAEASEIAAEAGDVYEFLVSQQYRHLALLYRGAWGELLRQLADAIAVAERSGHALWLDVFRFQEGFLRALAYDADGAVALCEVSAARARALSHASGESLNLAVMGRAHLAVGRPAEAQACFARLRELIPTVHPSALGVVLLLASAEGHLAAGETGPAAVAARLAEASARDSGDGAHLALARSLVAEVLAAERRLDAAEASLDAAVADLAETAALPAVWRVHASAARLAERRRRGEAARAHWSAAAAAVRDLTANLASEPTGAALAETFRSAPPVAEVLARAAAKRSRAS
jgi:DNA-binding winged helix-turn-helix (wHTH) protein/tetratricopeptide (TPR) repeat protein